MMSSDQTQIKILIYDYTQIPSNHCVFNSRRECQDKSFRVVAKRLGESKKVSEKRFSWGLLAFPRSHSNSPKLLWPYRLKNDDVQEHAFKKKIFKALEHL